MKHEVTVTDEAVERAAQALHDHRSVECGALHEVGQPLEDTVYDNERRADARAALEAAAPLIAAQALRDALARLGRAAAYAVDSTHHFHGIQCSCGFTGDARKRTQTEHITTAVLDAYNRMTDQIAGADS